MKSFEVPVHYRSPLISTIKSVRRKEDKMKKDFSPSSLQFSDQLHINLARHFGFCYGVENAIEIAFKAISENPDRKIYLLSEMIHNPQVNKDLLLSGVQFIMDTKGNQIISWDTINSEDIVIIPAFGTTVEIEHILLNKGIQPTQYNTTCPFVEKVWNRSEKIGTDGYSIIVHGKPNHEETRATFSHSNEHTPTVIVKDLNQTIELGKYITKEKPSAHFYEEFKGQYSENFDIERDLERIGVVNQTTMLASDTQEIADYLKTVMTQTYQLDNERVKERFADTRDTLCYATNDNQTAVTHMLIEPADFALVIGGYNSSNTSHLVELCEKTLPTFFINHEDCLMEDGSIKHYTLKDKKEIITSNYISKQNPIKVHITSGASCPDALVERVIHKLCTILNVDDLFMEMKAQ